MMVTIFTITWLLSSLFLMVTNALYVKKDFGKTGQEYWGKNFTYTEGSRVYLPCQIKPKAWADHHILIWEVMERTFGTKTYDKSLLAQMVQKGFPVSSSNVFGIDASLKARKLLVQNITRYATGTYRCVIISMKGRLTKRRYMEMVYMNVNVKAPARIESTMKTVIKLSAGQRLNLDCTSSGNPTPKITWRRSEGRPLSQKHIEHNKGLLSVLDVGQSDQGNYTCVSSNSIGKDEKTFTVDISVQARLMTTKKAYATIGEDGMVTCEAVGVPPPTFTWSWYEGNARVTLSEVDTKGRFSVKTEHKFEKSISYLMIMSVKRDDLHDYECSAKNKGSVRHAMKLITLTGYDVPQTPTIRAVAATSNTITVSWIFGKDGGKKITSVMIEYRTSNSTKWKSVSVKHPKSSRYTIGYLQDQTQYVLRVYAVNEIGKSLPSANHFEKTLLSEEMLATNNERIRPKESVNMTVMVGGVAGGFLVLIIAIVIVCILMRNIQRNSAKKAAESEQHATQNANPDTTALINYLQHGGERLSSPGGTVTNSGEVLQLTTSHKWEFPRDRLVLQNILGSGAFGIVMKAEADGINGINSGTVPVAVKFVKENESPSAKKDLIAELELLKLIEPHTNVINLLGCCTRSEPLMVIVEFCAYGDLQSFLRSSRGIRDPYYVDCYKRPSSRLTSKELLMFGTQIARGMAHLACMKVIHRDLAARNILVDENKVCKVSDFGFARDIYVEDHYTRKTAGGRFPIKWMAIESLLDGISTTKSDVWSFAIVLWEIITLGASPYPGMNSQEVVSFLQNGMRMDKPKHCSDELYNLLLDCWQVASHRRPNFEMLARYLDKMYNDDFEYINMRTYDDHLYINFDGNTISGGSNSASLVKQDSASSQQSQKSEDSLMGNA